MLIDDTLAWLLMTVVLFKKKKKHPDSVVFSCL